MNRRRVRRQRFMAHFNFGSMMSSDKPAQASQSGLFLYIRATRVAIHANPSPQAYSRCKSRMSCAGSWSVSGSRGQRCKLLLTVAPSTALMPNSDSEGIRAIRRFELCKQGLVGRTQGEGQRQADVERLGWALRLKSWSSV
jgi:hypothetical protein